MTVDLHPETQRLLEDRLKSGRYATADDVLRAALTALNDLESDELDKGTLDAIDRSEDQLDRGEGVKWKEVRDQIRASFHGE